MWLPVTHDGRQAISLREIGECRRGDGAAKIDVQPGMPDSRRTGCGNSRAARTQIHGQRDASGGCRDCVQEGRGIGKAKLAAHFGHETPRAPLVPKRTPLASINFWMAICFLGAIIEFNSVNLKRQRNWNKTAKNSCLPCAR